METLLSETIRSIPKHNIQIVGGDMNAEIGPDECNGFTFNRRTNENGLALLTLIDECGMVLLNAKFHKSRGNMWTFVYPNGEKVQLDCILINKKWHSSAASAEAYSSFSSVGSDHRIVTAKLQLRANKPCKHQPKYDWQALTESTDVVQKYQLEIQNRFNALNLEDNDQSAESIYRSITIAHDVKKTKKQLPWEHSNLAQFRANVKVKNSAYVKNPSREKRIPLDNALDTVKAAYDTKKQTYIENKIREIETAHITRKPKLAWATENEVANRKKSRAARPSIW